MIDKLFDDWLDDVFVFLMSRSKKDIAYRAFRAGYQACAAQQNAHLTPESLASSQAVVNASALEQSDGDSSPAQAQVA